MDRFGRGPLGLGRKTLAGVALVLAAPLAAQVAPATGDGSAPADTVGPRELRDFSLGNRPPLSAQAPPDLILPPLRTDRAPPPRPTPREAPAPVQGEAQPRTPVTGTQPDRSAGALEQPASRPVDTVAAPSAPAITPLPQPDPLASPPTPAPEIGPSLSSGTGPYGPSAAQPKESGPALWPWMLALLVLAGGAFLVLRSRSRVARYAEALADGPAPERPGRVDPAPMPSPPAPQAPIPTPMPSAAPTGGITVRRPAAFPAQQPETAVLDRPPVAPASPAMGLVSSRLRPWLDIALVPSRAVVDEAAASVEFDVVVTNSGNAPARQVLVEACMLNAGPTQDEALRRFFDAPVGQGERIAAIPPLGKIQLKSAVSLPLDQVQAYEVGGRKLFVPVIAFNALYEWGSSDGQSSASFIVGRGGGDGQPDGEGEARMAPIRLDLGPRVFGKLDARPHPVSLRR